MFGGLFGKKWSLEKELGDLAECGVKLLPAATPEALLAEWSEKQFRESPYLLAVALGNEEARLSENLWHFDTECIEDHGAYVRIAERLRDIARGDLPLADIEDYVDIEEERAWVAFTLDGKPYRWDCEVDDDWVDASVLSRFAELLAARGGERRFTYLDTGGQDCVIGCFRNDERERLRKVTKLDWQWLK
jgi:hypothetical protein